MIGVILQKQRTVLYVTYRGRVVAVIIAALGVCVGVRVCVCVRWNLIGCVCKGRCVCVRGDGCECKE